MCTCRSIRRTFVWINMSVGMPTCLRVGMRQLVSEGTSVVRVGASYPRVECGHRVWRSVNVLVDGCTPHTQDVSSTSARGGTVRGGSGVRVETRRQTVACHWPTLSVKYCGRQRQFWPRGCVWSPSVNGTRVGTVFGPGCSLSSLTGLSTHRGLYS